MGLLARYMSGLCVAVLGLCAAGWLALTPVAFGYRGPGLPSAGLPSAGLPSAGLPSAGLQRAVLADRATAGGLAVASLLTLLAWILAWRRKLRADGVLPTRISRGQTRREAREQRWRELATEKDVAPSTPDPAQVLSELRALLLPLLAEPPEPPEPPEAPVGTFENYPLPVSPAPSGIAAIESILAAGDLLMVGSGEEQAW
jgi:hypothetical protein